MPHSNDNRPLGELFKDLTHETQKLINQEIELAKTEISDKVSRMLKDVTAIGIGAFVAYTGVLVLVAAIVLALGRVIPLWASALVVGVIISGVGVALLMKGIKDLKETRMTPEKTAESLKETAKWAKAQMK